MNIRVLVSERASFYLKMHSIIILEPMLTCDECTETRAQTCLNILHLSFITSPSSSFTYHRIPHPLHTSILGWRVAPGASTNIPLPPVLPVFMGPPPFPRSLCVHGRRGSRGMSRAGETMGTPRRPCLRVPLVSLEPWSSPPLSPSPSLLPLVGQYWVPSRTASR